MKDNSIIKKITFENEKEGLYALDSINKTWNTPPRVVGLNERIFIEKHEGKKVLVIKYPKGIFGLEGGAQWRMNLDKSYDKLYVQYKVKFKKGFNFIRGGKLPGLCGGSNPSGGVDSSKGFSARLMWRRDKGKIEQYVYYPNREGTWGESLRWYDLNSPTKDKLRFEPGKWHIVKTKIIMNQFEPEKNGYIVSWFDGKLALHQEIKLKAEGENYGIDNFNFSTFFGGNDKTWAPEKDEEIYFDEFIISTDEILN